MWLAHSKNFIRQGAWKWRNVGLRETRCMTTMRKPSTNVESLEERQRTRWVRPELVPLLAMVSLALGLGVVSMYREMVHSPSVVVSKTRRTSLYEVDDPARAETLGHVFVDESPLRKLSHTTPHSWGPSIYTSPSSTMCYSVNIVTQPLYHNMLYCQYLYTIPCAIIYHGGDMVDNPYNTTIGYNVSFYHNMVLIWYTTHTLPP